MIYKIKSECEKANPNKPGTIEYLAFESGYYYGQCISLCHEINILKKIINEQKNILTDITFPKKYYLVYDIPENPLKRLPHLIQQIKSQQTNIGNRVTALKNSIHEMLTEIKDCKDPQKIAHLKQQIEKLNVEIETRQKEVEYENNNVEN